MTKFRPCIDLHEGQVKQIVGSTLTDNGAPTENHIAKHPAAWFAEKYCADQMTGGHVIKLGPGNEAAAKSALAEFPGGMQIGGGINLENAQQWLEAGASHVILTSWLFDKNGQFESEKLDALAKQIGKAKIVVDLSCKRTAAGWTVAMNRWQTLTNLNVDPATLDSLANRCDEFLIHAADVEGKCLGIDAELVELMGKWAKIPMTYAGGVASMDDVLLVESAGNGNIDVTVGSSLDLFGGSGITYQELVDWNQR